MIIIIVLFLYLIGCNIFSDFHILFKLFERTIRHKRCISTNMIKQAFFANCHFCMTYANIRNYLDKNAITDI